MAPIAIDWKSRSTAEPISSENAFPPVVPLVVPFEVELGAGDGDAADPLGAAVAPGDGIDVATAADERVADAFATWVAVAAGEGEVRPAFVNFSPLTAMATMSAIVATKLAIRPASQVARGAR
jgi:hypothetical protein